MKKILIWLLSIVFIASMAFAGISCKAEAVEEAAEEAVEEAAEEEVEEAAEEEVEEAAAMYSQAPMLNDMDLPPVEERLPKNPLVIEPYDEIGTYGGTYVRATAAFSEQQR
ncbi:unnamed protein product [marine sediment metagenome]|uniref:Uncharacterized protein n=1 Tax=marine sediment metagenome TaxID=412755 RepID=X0YSQ8_9ZZZZ